RRSTCATRTGTESSSTETGPRASGRARTPARAWRWSASPSTSTPCSPRRSSIGGSVEGIRRRACRRRGRAQARGARARQSRAGSLPGVSGFQLHFADHDILTPGDAPDVLVAMNPAALKTNLRDLPKAGTLIVNRDAFTERNLEKAGYLANPLEDGSLDEYHVHE